MPRNSFSHGHTCRLDITPARMRDISIAGAGLLSWVFAMINYFGVAKKVRAF